MKPTVVVPRTKWLDEEAGIKAYESYYDFWKILEYNNLPTCYIDQVNWEDHEALYIVVINNGEIIEDNFPKDRQCKIVWWCLERLSADTIPIFHEAWDEILLSCKYTAERYGLYFIPLWPEPKRIHRNDTPSNSGYNVIHLSYMSHRRQSIIPFLYEQFGWKLIENCWEPDRTKELERADYLLNIHQDANPQCEPLRFAIAAKYDLPILTELVIDPYPYEEVGKLPIAGKNEDLLWEYHDDGTMSRYLQVLVLRREGTVAEEIQKLIKIKSWD